MGRDDDQSTALRMLVTHGDDLALELVVERRCRLIQEQHRSAAIQCTRQRNSLPLTHGEIGPAFMKDAIIALMPRSDE